MTLSIDFEHDYQHKLMTQSFKEPTVLATLADVQSWRSAWMGALSSWHSPYKVLVDCRNLEVSTTPEVLQAVDLMVKFFNGFFLRKIVGYGAAEDRGYDRLPFPVLASADAAAIELGVRTPKDRAPSDFRSTIQLQNHFQQHVVELNFSEPVLLLTKEQLQVLRSKLMNNLMQWHSKWSLIIDCTNLEVAPEAVAEFTNILTALKGFFMKKAIGYSPKGAKETYPFDVFRARHRAAAALEAEGTFSGDDADCKSRKA